MLILNYCFGCSYPSALSLSDTPAVVGSLTTPSNVNSPNTVPTIASSWLRLYTGSFPRITADILRCSVAAALGIVRQKAKSKRDGGLQRL